MKKLLLVSFTILVSSLFLKAQNIDLPNQDFTLEINEIIPNSQSGFEVAYQPLTSQRGAIDPELADTLEGTLEAYFDKIGIKGLSVAVNIDGDIWTGTEGINTGIDPVTDNLLFAIGSVSKTLTATCVLEMYEDGLLDLDDPIDLYLPNFAARGDESWLKSTRQGVIKFAIYDKF